MNKARERTVYCRPDGKWVSKRRGTEKVTGVHQTLQEAVEEVSWDLMAQGGGEVTIIGQDGRIRSIDTISPGNSPFPPREARALRSHDGGGGS